MDGIEKGASAPFSFPLLARAKRGGRQQCVEQPAPSL